MSIRTERVAEMVQREVALILQREYSDQLQPMVTITRARVTGDLSIAYVYASVMGDTSEKREATFKQLKQLTPQIRDQLASRIRHEVKTIPELKFFLDESLQKAKRMETLFDRIQEERERREKGAEASDSASEEPESLPETE
jgi:ribosome-binding factor A